MNKDFKSYLLNKHDTTGVLPTNKSITRWALCLIRLLYPQLIHERLKNSSDIDRTFLWLEKELQHLLDSAYACQNDDNKVRAKRFMEYIPQLYRILNTDIDAILKGDPAAKDDYEVIRAYPGFYAIAFYRIAHVLWKLGIAMIPRILTEHAHSKTGIDIHPGADIDDHFFIDHGTGIVIGETAVIGKHVKLYQGVTLGALSVAKNMANTKRHPTIGNNVIIYSGASILGGETVIGDNCVIGGNVWLTKSVSDGSIVYYTSQTRIEQDKTL